MPVISSPCRAETFQRRGDCIYEQPNAHNLKGHLRLAWYCVAMGHRRHVWQWTNTSKYTLGSHMLHRHFTLLDNKHMQSEYSVLGIRLGTGNANVNQIQPLLTGGWHSEGTLSSDQQIGNWSLETHVLKDELGTGHNQTEMERDDAPKEIVIKVWPKEWITVGPVDEEGKKKVRNIQAWGTGLQIFIS